MHDASQKELTAAVAELARLRSIRRRVDDGMGVIYARLAGQGFSQSDLDRALSLIDVDLNNEGAELKRVKALLDAMRAPVQIEMVGLYETPVSESSHLDEIEDEGWWARLSDRGRKYSSFVEVERQAFFRGYDACDALLRETAA